MREALQGAHLKKRSAYRRTLAGDIRCKRCTSQETHACKSHTPVNASAYPVVIGHIFYHTIQGDNHRTLFASYCILGIANALGDAFKILAIRYMSIRYIPIYGVLGRHPSGELITANYPET